MFQPRPQLRTTTYYGYAGVASFRPLFQLHCDKAMNCGIPNIPIGIHVNFLSSMKVPMLLNGRLEGKPMTGCFGSPRICCRSRKLTLPSASVNAGGNGVISEWVCGHRFHAFGSVIEALNKFKSTMLQLVLRDA